MGIQSPFTSASPTDRVRTLPRNRTMALLRVIQVPNCLQIPILKCSCQIYPSEITINHIATSLGSLRAYSLFKQDITTF